MYFSKIDAFEASKPSAKKISNFIFFIRIGLLLLINLLQDVLSAKRITIARNKVVDSKTAKYYFSAGIAGGFIQREMQIQDKTKIFKKNYSFLFSYWAILLINLDRYSDCLKNKKNESIQAHLFIAYSVYEEIVAKNYAFSKNEMSVFRNWIKSYSYSRNEIHLTRDIVTMQYFVKKFVYQASCCLDQIPNENTELVARNISEALDAFMKLMDAQIGSFSQSEISEEYNWGWYSKKILKNKFDNIFLSILNLFPKTYEEVFYVKQVISGIGLINELFLHRQILDDLIDFEEDIENGILATPTYILLDFDRNILPDDFLGTHFFERLENNKNYQRGCFNVAWRKGEFLLCKELLIKSSIINYFIDLIEDNKRANEISQRIESYILLNKICRDSLSLYYKRCIKSYAKFKNKYFAIRSY